MTGPQHLDRKIERPDRLLGKGFGLVILIGHLPGDETRSHDPQAGEADGKQDRSGALHDDNANPKPEIIKILIISHESHQIHHC